MPSRRNDRVSISLGCQGILYHLQASVRLGKDFRSVFVSCPRLCDFHCVARFVHLQRNVWIRCKSQGVPHLLVLSTLHKLVLTNRENLALRVFPSLALKNYHFARHADGKIRFGCNNQREGLCRRRRTQFALPILGEENFSRVAGAPFWGNYPEYVGQVFRSEVRGRRHVFQLDLNLRSPSLSFGLNFGNTIGFRHQICALQIDFRATTPDLVANGTHGFGDEAGRGDFWICLRCCTTFQGSDRQPAKQDGKR